MLLLLLLLPAASAKDLNGRLGVGASQQLGGVSSLSVRYGLPLGKPTVNFMVEGDLGIAALDSHTTQIFAGGRMLYGVVAEDNMNLYLGIGAGYHTAGTDSALRVQPALGAEFFFFGLDNLGFDAELGVNVDVGDEPRVSVSGAPMVGFHYYF